MYINQGICLSLITASSNDSSLKIINFYLISYYYLLKDNEDYSHHRSVICIILYSGKLLAKYRNTPYHTANMSKKQQQHTQKPLQRFLNVPHITVVYQCLGEPLPLTIKVKGNQVINR